MSCGCTANKGKTMSRQVTRRRGTGGYTRNVIHTASARKQRVIIKRPAR